LARPQQVQAVLFAGNKQPDGKISRVPAIATGRIGNFVFIAMTNPPTLKGSNSSFGDLLPSGKTKKYLSEFLIFTIAFSILEKAFPLSLRLMKICPVAHSACPKRGTRARVCLAKKRNGNFLGKASHNRWIQVADMVTHENGAMNICQFFASLDNDFCHSTASEQALNPEYGDSPPDYSPAITQEKSR